MKLYLLSSKNIQTHAERILPLLPEQRRLAYDRSRSGLTLGAGLLLSSLLGVRSNADLSMGAYGKPFLTCGTPEFSLSHSGEHVLLGVSDQPIGVDMERSGRQVPEAVRRRDASRRLFPYYSKTRGRNEGLFPDPSSFFLRFPRPSVIMSQK